MVDTLENREQYHDVIASSIGDINRLLANKQASEAVQILKCNIVYAFCLSEMDDSVARADANMSSDKLLEHVEALKLKEKHDVLELYSLMTYYQFKAGIKPIQRERMFGKKFAQFRKAMEQ